MAKLTKLNAALGSKEERRARAVEIAQSRQSLVSLCQREGLAHLAAGNSKLAIPDGLLSLKVAKKLYGEKSIRLVPSYLLLAEANTQAGEYKLAEEYLLFANWTATKTPNCSNDVLALINRNFGKLYCAQQQFEMGLRRHAEDVYYCSLEYGPEHLATTAAYFYMARAFLQMSRAENGLAFFDKIVDILFKFLQRFSSTKKEKGLEEVIGVDRSSEIQRILQTIYETRRELLGEGHVASAEAAQTLAMLRMELGDLAEAQGLFQNALQIYEAKLGGDHALTAAVKSRLAEITRLDAGESRVSDDEKGAGRAV